MKEKHLIENKVIQPITEFHTRLNKKTLFYLKKTYNIVMIRTGIKKGHLSTGKKPKTRKK